VPERGPAGPRFAPVAGTPHTAIVTLNGDERQVTGTIFSYWIYQLPNFILAALMYTLLGRVLLGLFVDPDSPNYIWRFFCRITDPFLAAIALVTPKVTPPVIVWLFGFVWLFWLRVGLLYLFLLLGAVPQVK
jgi:YggT family protein